MSERVAALLRRAQTEVEAARTLTREGFELQAISRAYFAAFYAAEAALLSLGETRSKHSGVLAAFGRLVVKEGGLDPQFGATPRRLFELRNAADYAWLEESESLTRDPADEAEAFVGAVEMWIEQQRAVDHDLVDRFKRQGRS